jgi:hypothetical protein
VPPLPNERRELFAQHIASGHLYGESYVLAGYRPNPGKASHLRANAKVAARIREIQEERERRDSRAAEIAAQKAAVSVESLLRELEEARVAAMADGQFGAAVAAVKEKGVLAGVRVERSEQRHLGDFDQLSLEELRRELFVQARELGLHAELLLEDGRTIDGEAVDGSDPPDQEVANQSMARYGDGN